MKTSFMEEREREDGDRVPSAFWRVPAAKAKNTSPVFHCPLSHVIHVSTEALSQNGFALFLPKPSKEGRENKNMKRKNA